MKVKEPTAFPSNEGDGITKREYFAIMILQGLSSWDPNKGEMICDYKNTVEVAVRRADQLIKYLSEG